MLRWDSRAGDARSDGSAEKAMAVMRVDSGRVASTWDETRRNFADRRIRIIKNACDLFQTKQFRVVFSYFFFEFRRPPPADPAHTHTRCKPTNNAGKLLSWLWLWLGEGANRTGFPIIDRSNSEMSKAQAGIFCEIVKLPGQLNRYNQM